MLAAEVIIPLAYLAALSDRGHFIVAAHGVEWPWEASVLQV